MKKNCILYLKNGDIYLGDHYTVREAIKILKDKGYKKYYGGFKDTIIFSEENPSVIVGINKNNTVPLKQREKNGLGGAYIGRIK